MDPAPTPPASAPRAATEPRRRLHPLTPLLRGGRFAILTIVAISWQGYDNLGTQSWLAAIAGVAVLALIGSFVSYRVTGYHVVGRELRIYEGLLFRRTRSIPVERLQSAEIVQPLLARIFGLAELRLEVVGGSSTEAPLAFLSRQDATELRTRLLALARPAAPLPEGSSGGALGTQPAGVAASAGLLGTGFGEFPQATTPAPERVVHRVANRDLVLSQMLRPQWLLLPFAVAVPLVFFTNERELNFIAVASTLTAIVGAISAPVRVLLGDWRFTLGNAADGLHVRRGLLETRHQTVPTGRIQSVAVEWPLLWRRFGWVRASMHVAGVKVQEGIQQRSGLLPVGTVGEAQSIVAEALPGFVLRDVAVQPVPPQAKWLAPLRRRVLGFQLSPTAFVCRDGVLTRRLVVVPYERIQSVRVRQGPLQRRLRLATVIADVAGGSVSGFGYQGEAPHLDITQARALALELAERSRAARSR
jgi:putative membrane protein